MKPTSPKEFAYSYTKLKNFEVCPRRYVEVDVKKAWPEPESEQLIRGNVVHKAMAKALQSGTELPAQFATYQPWIDRINDAPGELLVECQWAITRQFQPTAWFSNKVWLRAIADAVKIRSDARVGWIIDFKTGKSSNVDPVQLTLASLVALIQFPKLLSIRSDFIWLEEDEHTEQSVYRHEAADRWAEILPRVDRLEQATVDQEFPPKPNHLCAKWCPVLSCEYNGRKQ
jgi:hypothetical protein